jgi:hypothetical protein
MAMKAKVSTGVVSVLMMLLFLVPVDAGTAGHGMGMHGMGMHGMGMRAFHAGGHFAPRHFGRFARHHFFRNRQVIGVWPWWPWYGYYNAPYAYDDYSTPQAVVAPQEPRRAACQHSEQTRTVPSANGGTTEVTILRC